MPIKLPKGFVRRKSSGNVLEENPTPAQPSFRVIERQPDSNASKSFDGGSKLLRALGEDRPVSAGQLRDYEQGRPGANRGSGGTQNSASTGGLYDTSSSARYSSSSTLPSSSSLDASQDDLSHAHPKHPKKAALAQQAPSGFSLRAGVRTFSFGARKAMQTPSPSREIDVPAVPQPYQEYSDIPGIKHTARQRAMTETSYASGSTATPPKLIDTDFGGESDGFGNMFANMGAERRKSRALDLPKTSSPDNLNNSQVKLSNPSSSFTSPGAINMDKTKQPVSPALYSGTSHTSGDGLLSSSPQDDQTQFGNRGSTYDSYGASYAKPLPSKPISTAYQTTSKAREQRPQVQSRNDYGAPSPTLLNDDTRLAMQYMGSSELSKPEKRKSLPPLPRKLAPGPTQPRPVTLYDGDNQDFNSDPRSDDVNTTPKAKKATLTAEGDALLNDLDFQEMAMVADSFQPKGHSPPRRAVRPPGAGKVMTPAQFEQYKKEQDMKRRTSMLSKSESDSEEEDNYEEEDEQERNREMARQRRRQEARMTVYRQQMMRVTGEPQPLNNGQRGYAMPTSNNSSNPHLVAGQNSADEDDDDDDIPLGILAAHGFPKEGVREPSKNLTSMSSNPQIKFQVDAYPAPPASVSGRSLAGGALGKSVPAFARNLPKDPFNLGSGLVNPSDRQSLAFGAGGSTYGGSQAGGPPSGGLVGVIAKEERARAIRRGGSPAAAAMAMEQAQPLLQGMNGNSPPGVANSDTQAQLAMSQQMAQMMQQMQMMQQQMMMGMQQGQQMPQMGMAGMPGGMHGGTPQLPPMQMGVGSSMHLAPNADPYGPRPNSMGSMTGTGAQRAPPGGRTMSMMTPDAHNFNGRQSRASGAPSVMMGTNGHRGSLSHASGMAPAPHFLQGNGYASSLAPSERSNVGMASRYRPVSVIPGADGARSNTMGSGALKGWEEANAIGKGKAAATVRMVPLNKEPSDDEDEGWEEMKKRREKTKSMWKGKKGGAKKEESGLEGVFYPLDQD